MHFRIKPWMVATTLAVGLLGMETAPARAQTTYADRASFQAASSGRTLISFEGAPSGSYSQHHTASGLTFNGVQFVGVANNGDHNLYWMDSDYKNSYGMGTGDNLVGGYGGYVPRGSGGYLDIKLAPGTTAVAFDFGLTGYDPAGGDPYQITLSNGNVFSGSHVARPGTNLFGFTSSEAITSIRLKSQTSDFVLLDNFEFSAADAPVSAVPEPASLTLMLPGLGAVALLKRRKQPAA